MYPTIWTYALLKGSLLMSSYWNCMTLLIHGVEPYQLLSAFNGIFANYSILPFYFVSSYASLYHYVSPKWLLFIIADTSLFILQLSQVSTKNSTAINSCEMEANDWNGCGSKPVTPNMPIMKVRLVFWHLHPPISWHWLLPIVKCFFCMISQYCIWHTKWFHIVSPLVNQAPWITHSAWSFLPPQKGESNTSRTKSFLMSTGSPSQEWRRCRDVLLASGSFHSYAVHIPSQIEATKAHLTMA